MIEIYCDNEFRAAMDPIATIQSPEQDLVPLIVNLYYLVLGGTVTDPSHLKLWFMSLPKFNFYHSGNYRIKNGFQLQDIPF